MDWFFDLITNECLVAGISAWLVAQVIKAIIYLIINKKFEFHRLFGDGGMPSGHSATVAAVATMTALIFGLNSFEFAISMVLALIVGHDAMGVRREAGKQAAVLNTLIELLSTPLTSELHEVKLKEFVGHTLSQVVCGAVLGFANALIFCCCFSKRFNS